METIIAQIVFFAFLAVVGVMTTAVLSNNKASGVEEDAIREHFEEELKQKDRIRLVR